MSYGAFKSVEEVAQKFDIEVLNKLFINRRAIDIQESSLDHLKTRLYDDLNFINETTVCERIICPILDLIEVNYAALRVWSHVPFNVDKEQGLIGEPDYLIAQRTKYGGMGVPPLCVIEAKQEKFDEGWTQALAEMVAASLQGAKICYGVVTTGKIWEFGQFQRGFFIKDPRSISAADNLLKVLEVLNWLFDLINPDH